MHQGYFLQPCIANSALLCRTRAVLPSNYSSAICPRGERQPSLSVLKEGAKKQRGKKKKTLATHQSSNSQCISHIQKFLGFSLLPFLPGLRTKRQKKVFVTLQIILFFLEKQALVSKDWFLSHCIRCRDTEAKWNRALHPHFTWL